LNTYVIIALTASLASLALSVYAALKAMETWGRVAETRRLLSRVLGYRRVVERLSRVRSKPRRRYIVFSYIGDIGDDDRGRLEEEILAKYKDIFGERGVELAKPRLIVLDPSLKCGIVRVRHTYVNHLIGVLGLVRRLGDRRVILAPTRTTGTLRKAREICRQTAGFKR